MWFWICEKCNTAIDTKEDFKPFFCPNCKMPGNIRRASHKEFNNAEIKIVL